MALATFRVRNCALLVVLCGAVVPGIGCGGSGSSVTGKVTVGGKALNTGTVVYKPNKAKGNTSLQEAIGEIDDQGNYTLKVGGKTGVPPGWYKVVVNATEPVSTDPAMMGKLPKSLVNAKYNLENTSDLEKEVVASPPAGAYDLPLTR